MVMRKNYQMWLLGALVGGLVLPFAGCSNEDDPTPNRPGNGEDVKTELALIVSKKVDTKAATGEVDQLTTFSGMEDIRLLAYGGAALGSHEEVLADDKLNSVISLENFDAFTSDDGNVKVYQNVSLPKAAVNFMFYAKSQYAYGGVNSGRDQSLQVSYPEAGTGAGSGAGTGQADATTFTLNPLTAENSNTSEMTTYINGVLSAAVAALNDGRNAASTDLKTKFVNYVTAVESPALYQVAYMMAQLYLDTDFGALNSGTATWDAVKSAIINNSSANFVFNQADPTSFDDWSDFKAVVNKANEKYLGASYPVGGQKLSITFTGTDETNLDGLNVEIADPATNTYYYPTPLYYMANTCPVEFTDASSYTWGSQPFVNLSTASPTKIALKDQIKFAVGKLNLVFTVDKNGDNSISGADDPDFTATFTKDNLKVVGIFLNNQKQVGWDFLAGSETAGVAYDNIPASDGEEISSMLAFATATNAKVKIALEIQNTSDKSFKGLNGGIIPAGATFYVVGEIDPTTGSLAVGSEQPKNYPAVFTPDYETTVNVNLTSLEEAYNTVPDLNAANLEFALSVDLNWTSGYTFDVTIP